MRIFLLPIVVFLLSLTATAQQRPQFTQYMFNSMGVNPAYAGMDESLSLTFINRQQWSGVENAPITQTLTAHSLLKKKHLGLGISIVNDKIGVHKNQSALGNVAYHINLGKESSLSMGMLAGIYSIKSDYASLLVGAGNDPALVNNIVSTTFFDMGAGFYFKSPRLHIGISAPELLPRSFSLADTIKVKLRSTNLFLFSKYTMYLGQYFKGEPSVMIKYLYGLPFSYDLNMNFIYKNALTTGISFRKGESVALLIKAQISQQLQAGYAFDYPIGEGPRLGSGSHEIMVNYQFRYFSSQVSSPR